MTQYIHYGADSFDISKFKELYERPDGDWIKPYGGLWASRVSYGSDEGSWVDWREWCLENDWHTDSLDSNFVFSLKPDARIFTVRGLGDLTTLAKLGVYISNNLWYYTKMTKLKELGYDGIEVFINVDLYDALYGWDCNSLLIFNSDCMVLE